MASMLESGAKLSRREQNLRPEQIEALRLKREPKDHSVVCLEQEDGEGNVEYKFRIKDPHPVRLQQLITQMKFRLSEGNGECFYYIGIEDNGYPKGLEPADLEGSIATLHRMAASLDAYVTLLHYLPAAWGRRAALLRVATRTAQEACHTDLRIAVAGSVDAGKSTLVAVLTHGSDSRPLLDNGRGLARMAVFRHKHEMQSGRTSSICHQLLGYDCEGRVINYATPAASALTPAEITGSAAKVLTFLDLGGHERYLKTALYGMTALLPDYALLCVCAVAGPGRIAREHLAVAVALEVPVAVVVTKVELVRPERFAAVISEVRQLVALTLQHESGPGIQADERRVEDASPLVTSEGDALASAAILGQLHADSLASPTARGALRVHMPIFPISAVTGTGLPILHAFLNALQPGSSAAKGGATAPPLGTGLAADAGAEPLASAGSGSCGDSSTGYTSSGWGGSPKAAAVAGLGASPYQALQSQHLYGLAEAPAAPAQPPPPAEAQPVHFQVDGTFEVEGVGLVVSGTLLSGMVRLGQELMLGPTPGGSFTRVVVRQLQRSHVQVKQVRAGQTCTIAISPPGPCGSHGWGPATGRGYADHAVDSAAGSRVAGPGNGASVFNGDGMSDKAQLPLGTSPGFDDALAAAQAALELCLAGDSEEDGAGCGGGGADDLFAFDVSDGPGFSPPPASSRRHTSTTLSSSPSPRPPLYLAGGLSSIGSDCPPLGASYMTGATAMVASRAGCDPLLPQSVPGACQLHSTTSFCVGAGVGVAGRVGGGGAALSTSAPPTRTMSAGAVAPLFSPAVTPTRKGSVLLEPTLQPKTSWTFEAVLILLGGHWPPRGLVSGRWPPACEEDLPEALRPETATTAASEPVSFSEPASERPGSSNRSSSSCLTSQPSGCATPLAAAAAVAATAADGSGSVDGHVSSSAAEEGDGAAGGDGSDGTAATRELPAIPGAMVEPPFQYEPITAAVSGVGGGGHGRHASVSSGGRMSGRRRRQRGLGPGTYVTVVHCGSVRQPAHVLMIQELQEDSGDGDAAADGSLSAQHMLRISASTRAAAALMHSAQHAQRAASNTNPSQLQSQPGNKGGSNGSVVDAQRPMQPPQPPEHEDLGCLVRVLLRWQHRPEWLREGARLLLRDRSDGRVAGAGFVRRVLL